MTREQCIETAKIYAKKEGWSVPDYMASDFQSMDEETMVKFSGKSERPGDHFTVYIDSKSGTVLRLIPGR
jgi:hypothetical protein